MRALAPLAPPPSLDRRLLLAVLATSLAARPRRARASSSSPAVDDAVATFLPASFRASGRVLVVADSLTDALASAGDGDAVVLPPGHHVGRALLPSRVALLGCGAAVTRLTWTTAAPYESVVVVQAAGCVVAGVGVTHASPSVANNYAVHVLASDAVVTDCAISSATGTGVGVEGDGVTVARCEFKQNAGYGVAVFGDGATVRACVARGNRRGGVLVRGAVSAAVDGLSGGDGVSVAGGGEAVVDGRSVV